MRTDATQQLTAWKCIGMRRERHDHSSDEYNICDYSNGRATATVVYAANYYRGDVSGIFEASVEGSEYWDIGRGETPEQAIAMAGWTAIQEMRRAAQFADEVGVTP